MDAPETLEELQSRHRKEQRDLIARITQKKKSANKKTRKGVNDECDRLELNLKEQQAQELSAIKGETLEEDQTEQEEQEDATKDETQTNDTENGIEAVSVHGSQPDDSEQNPSQPQSTKKKQNRAKARLARRAAEQDALVAQAKAEAAALPDPRKLERTRMREQFNKHGLQEKEIRADGHCLYAAVADQMESAGLDLKPRIQPKVNEDGVKVAPYKAVRGAAADFIEHHPDEFVGFMEEPLEEYLRKIRDTGEWGGHMELMALAKTYGIKINVLHGDGQVDKIESGEMSGEDEKEIWLGYYKHSHGLGEHYNSLRKTP